jgi:hypothetical protein
MKTLVNSALMVAIVVAMNGCAEEAAVEEPLRISFKINSPDGQSPTDISSETALLVSMETPAGDPLYTLENIAYTKTEDGFNTTALDLQPGEYVLTEFMLVDANGKIQYTIPYTESPLSTAVPRPLGIDFSFAANSKTDVQTEVLTVQQYSPIDFGLASFSTQNSFQILVNESGSGKAVSASAAILHDQDTVMTFAIPAKKTRISFDGDPSGTYTLVVAKGAFASFSQDFTLSDWASTYRNKPFKVSLSPAFTMTANVGSIAEYPFSFQIGGTDVTLSVDWGDGTVETHEINETWGTEVAHNYAAEGFYPITITGDLDRITYFYSFYGGSEFNDVHFDHLVNLIEIRYGLTRGPAVVDLSRNINLESAMLPGLMSMSTLILPESHKLIFLEIDGANLLDAADVDGVIDNIYNNVVNGNIRDGLLGIRASWAQDENDYTMLGPPSEASMTKLDELKNSFGWNIHPSQPDEKLISDGRIRLNRQNM